MADKLKALARRLMLFYRITPEEQKRIEEYQALHPHFKYLLGNRMGTDHNHTTGLIRGRLDWRINKAYGAIENAFPNHTAQVLRALARYHEEPPAVTVIGPRFGLIGRAQVKKKMVYGPPEGYRLSSVKPDLSNHRKSTNFETDMGWVETMADKNY